MYYQGLRDAWSLVNTEDLDPGYTFSALQRPHQLVKRVSLHSPDEPLSHDDQSRLYSAPNEVVPIRFSYQKLGVFGFFQFCLVLVFYCSLHSLIIDHGHGGHGTYDTHSLTKVKACECCCTHMHAHLFRCVHCHVCMLYMHHFMLAIWIYALKLPAQKSKMHIYLHTYQFAALECSNLCTLLFVFSTMSTVFPTSVYTLGQPLF